MTQDELSTQVQRYNSTREILFSMADNSIREIIAFDDIVAYAANDPETMTDKWLQKNIPLMDKASVIQFATMARKMSELVREAGVRADADPTGASQVGTVRILPGDAGAAFNDYFAVATLSLVNHAEVTSRAFLIAAESSFEVLFGQTARVVYEKNPQALPKSDHAFTFEELASYNSISDARTALKFADF